MPTPQELTAQLLGLLILTIPVACIAWTVTHEEVFRELRQCCISRSQTARRLLWRKLYYLLTCEYCFSHYVALLFVALSGFRMLLEDWRGYVISFFAVVWVANVYMSLYSHLRVEIRVDRAEIQAKEQQMQQAASDQAHGR